MARYTMKDGTRERFGTPQSIEASVAHDAFFGPEVDAQLEQIAGAPAPEPHGCLYRFVLMTEYRGNYPLHDAMQWLRRAMVEAREGNIGCAINFQCQAVASAVAWKYNTVHWHRLLNRVAYAIADEARKQRENEDPRWSMEQEWRDRRDAELTRALERTAQP